MGVISTPCDTSSPWTGAGRPRPPPLCKHMRLRHRCQVLTARDLTPYGYPSRSRAFTCISTVPPDAAVLWNLKNRVRSSPRTFRAVRMSYSIRGSALATACLTKYESCRYQSTRSTIGFGSWVDVDVGATRTPYDPSRLTFRVDGLSVTASNILRTVKPP